MTKVNGLKPLNGAYFIIPWFHNATVFTPNTKLLLEHVLT